MEEEKKIGRPKREFDKQAFEGLCQIQCTVNEIEKILHTDQRILDNWCKREYEGDSFNTIYKRFAEGGKASIRRNQLALSKKSAAMAIWLGKIYLGQRDTSSNEELLNVITNLSSIVESLRKGEITQKEVISE